jgi:hypothetical protein
MSPIQYLVILYLLLICLSIVDSAIIQVIIAILFIIILIIINTKKKTLERNGKPYLIRYSIFSCRWFAIKIHKILVSDPNEPHDHPWNYLSIILWGGYWEEQRKMRPNNVDWDMTIIWCKPGSILYRKGDKLHRLIIPKRKYCLSLVITSRKWRDWGYIRGNKWQKHID